MVEHRIDFYDGPLAGQQLRVHDPPDKLVLTFDGARSVRYEVDLILQEDRAMGLLLTYRMLVARHVGEFDEELRDDMGEGF